MKHSLIIFPVILTGALCQDCTWVSRLDCTTYGRKPICGSNYVTYENRCDFAKVHCTNPSINILYEKPCVSTVFTSSTTIPNSKQTTSQRPVSTTHDFLRSAAPTAVTSTNGGRDHLCSQINSMDCLFGYVPNGDETLCASNNQTYQNFCFYSRVRCRFPKVHLVNLGPCHKPTAPTQIATTSTQASTTVVMITRSQTSVKPTPCSPNPCLHGGSCEDLPGTFHCHCTAGYIGQMCEQDYDECKNSPCKNGGSCTNIVGSYKCICPTGYSGLSCENGSVVCEDTPSFPCDYMLQYNMCDKNDIAMKCGHTCFQDVIGFPCADMLKFGMCNDPSIKEKCKTTCRKCPQRTQIDSFIG